MGSTYGLVGPDGWRIDPWHTHEFRYYSSGVATPWVSSSGLVSEEFAVSVDELLDEFAAMQIVAHAGAPPVTGSPARAAYPPDTTTPDTTTQWERAPRYEAAPPYLAPQYEADPPYLAPQYDAALPVEAPPYRALQHEDPLYPARPHQAPPYQALRQQPAIQPHPEPQGWSTPGASDQAGSDHAGSDRAVPSGPSASADAMQTARPTPRPRAPSAAVVATAVVALVLVGSLASFAATHGSQPVRFSVASTTVTSTTKAPTPATAPPNTLSADSRLQAWWTTAGQPDTQTLAADIALLGGRATGSATLSGDCRIFATDAAAAGAAPTPPSTTIEREWQQTLSTVKRIASACAASRYSQMAADLQPASYTIADLTAQVAGHLGGA